MCRCTMNNRDVPRVMKTKFPDTVMIFGGPHHATSHLRSRLESQHQSVPGCAEECGDPLVQSGGRWQILSVAVGLGAGLQVQRDPGLVSKGVLRLCTLLSLIVTRLQLGLNLRPPDDCLLRSLGNQRYAMCPARLFRVNFWDL